MDAADEEETEASRALLKRECDNLLSEIARLEMSRGMQNKRLKNVMNLVSVCPISMPSQLPMRHVQGLRHCQYCR